MACAQVPGSSRLLYNRYGQSEAFTGIAALRADAQCTASFLKPLSGTAPSGAPAYVVANGHCLGFLRTNEVILDSARGGSVTFGRFIDTPEKQDRFSIRRTVYATMKGTDLSIFELDASYAQLVSRGYRPLEIQSDPPPPGEPVSAVGMPVSGVPQDEQYLRQADCRISGQAQLIEFNWTWYGFLRTDCADIKPGSSGSPLISLRTGKLVGVINTTTQDAPHIGPGFACYLGVPCEIRPDGPATVRDAVYALPVAGLERCFNPAGAFDVALAGCPLDKGRQFALSGYPIRVTQPYKDGRRVTWNTTISGAAFTHYRYKIVQETTGDCRSAQGYGPVLSLAASNRIDETLPENEVGTYLCVQGGNSPTADSSWQDLRHATFAHVRIDSSPSTVTPVVSLRDDGRDYRVDFEFVLPELSGYHYKFGHPDATACHDPQGYVPFRRIPLRISKAEPVRFCAVGEDNAGNWTAPYVQLLDGLQILKDGVVCAANFQPTPLAPGALATVFGVNFGGEDLAVAVADAAGRQWPAQVFYAGQDQINFLVPSQVSPGAATLIVSRRNGTAGSFAAVRVDAASPGVFSASPLGGAALAYVRRLRPDGSTSNEPAFNCTGVQCYPNPIYLAVGDRVSVELFLTGLGGAAPEVRISGLLIPVGAYGPLQAAAGVDRIEFEIPYSIPVRSYVPLTVKAGANTSRAVYLWLK
jgi:uncharacterized protein (TIGR03437 family)